jgi:hypothetical protein
MEIRKCEAKPTASRSSQVGIIMTKQIVIHSLGSKIPSLWQDVL